MSSQIVNNIKKLKTLYEKDIELINQIKSNGKDKKLNLDLDVILEGSTTGMAINALNVYCGRVLSFHFWRQITRTKKFTAYFDLVAVNLYKVKPSWDYSPFSIKGVMGAINTFCQTKDIDCSKLKKVVNGIHEARNDVAHKSFFVPSKSGFKTFEDIKNRYEEFNSEYNDLITSLKSK